MATAKSKNTVASVNARCDELENIVTRLEARIAELEGNLNQDSDSPPSGDDGWRERVVNVLNEIPVLRRAVERNNL